MGSRKLDTFYHDDGTLTGFLGTVKPSFLETVACEVFRVANDERRTWAHTSDVIRLVRLFGSALGAAASLTFAVVFFAGLLITDPRPLVGTHSLERRDEFGDFLTVTTFILWCVSAFLLFASKIVTRDEGFPLMTSPTLPWTLFNHAHPSRGSSVFVRDWYILAGVALFEAAVTVTSVHAIIGTVYHEAVPLFAVLFLLQAFYVCVSSLRDVFMCGSPFGIPRGWCRKLLVVRALIVTPACTIFSVGSVTVSFPWFYELYR
tara:strand:- start:83 stop:865 length:783 start_codon:yes stop_codon:yes gene_type:complete